MGSFANARTSTNLLSVDNKGCINAVTSQTLLGGDKDRSGDGN